MYDDVNCTIVEGRTFALIIDLGIRKVSDESFDEIVLSAQTWNDDAGARKVLYCGQPGWLPTPKLRDDRRDRLVARFDREPR